MVTLALFVWERGCEPSSERMRKVGCVCEREIDREREFWRCEITALMTFGQISQQSVRPNERERECV